MSDKKELTEFEQEKADIFWKVMFEHLENQKRCLNNG